MRQRFLIWAIAAASPALSQAPPGDVPANSALTRDDVEMRAATNFGMFDTDEDGLLTAKEVNAPRQTMVSQNEFTKSLLDGILAKIDKDKNGWISIAEYLVHRQILPLVTRAEVLARSDSNKDQKISLEEFRQAQKKLATQSSTDTFFNHFDADKDSYWAAPELDVAMQQAQQAYEREMRIARDEYAQLDTDRNERVSRDEYRKVFPVSTPLKVDTAFADYDSNKDGKISRAEFQARAMAEFDRLDLDKDGVIRGAEQTLKCTKGFGSATFLAPTETVRPMCQEAGK